MGCLFDIMDCGPCGGLLFGEDVYQSVGRLLEEIWYLPHTCTDVAFASGMFLF